MPTDVHLAIRDLSVCVEQPNHNPQYVLRGLDLEIKTGQTVSVLGRSGSGKSTLVNAILGTLPSGMTLSDGTVALNEMTVWSAGTTYDDSVRGCHIGVVFQDSAGVFNPLYTIGKQIVDICVQRLQQRYEQCRVELLELLKCVAFANPEQVFDSYPHQLSGGMLQRCQFALALALRPKLLIADEPFSSLDATVSAQLATLLSDLAMEHGLTFLFITHSIPLAYSLTGHLALLSDGAIIQQLCTDTTSFIEAREAIEHILNQDNASHALQLIGEI